MKIINNEIIASKGKFIHRINNDLYFTRCTLLQNETINSFEEVDTVPLTPEEQQSEYLMQYNK